MRVIENNNIKMFQFNVLLCLRFFFLFLDWCYELGFDPLINQKLLPPTFPRYTKIKPASEAYLYFDSLLTRLKQICKLTNCVTFISALVCFILL